MPLLGEPDLCIMLSDAKCIFSFQLISSLVVFALMGLLELDCCLVSSHVLSSLCLLQFVLYLVSLKTLSESQGIC